MSGQVAPASPVFTPKKRGSNSGNRNRGSTILVQPAQPKKSTTIILTDRVTMSPLTVNPATVATGDWWFRQDLGRPVFAIDTVVANSKTGVIVPVVTADINDLAVTTAKVDDLAITTAKLADSAVSTAKIVDSAVTTGKLADSVVATAKIVDSAVTTAKIADTAVTDAKIANVAPGKILTGDLNLGTGTLTAGQVTVGDFEMNFGWKIKETEKAIIFLKNNKVVACITQDGKFLSSKIKAKCLS